MHGTTSLISIFLSWWQISLSATNVSSEEAFADCWGMIFVGAVTFLESNSHCQNLEIN